MRKRGEWCRASVDSLDAGGAPYAIYLCHTIFFVARMQLGLNPALRGWPDLAAQLLFPTYCGLIAAFCVARYCRVERPLHRVFKRGLRVSRPARCNQRAGGKGKPKHADGASTCFTVSL